MLKAVKRTKFIYFISLITFGIINFVLNFSYAPRLPLPGETLHGSSFNFGFGGKGANQAVAASKLGANVAMIARV